MSLPAPRRRQAHFIYRESLRAPFFILYTIRAPRKLDWPCARARAFCLPFILIIFDFFLSVSGEYCYLLLGILPPVRQCNLSQRRIKIHYSTHAVSMPPQLRIQSAIFKCYYNSIQDIHRYTRVCLYTRSFRALRFKIHKFFCPRARHGPVVIMLIRQL